MKEESAKETTQTTLSENIEVIETTITTEWSEPDSVGNQYPTKTTTSSREINKCKQQELNSNKAVTNTEITAQSDSTHLSYNEEITAQTEIQKEVDVSEPKWTIAFGIILLIAIIIIALLLYKLR